MSTITAATKPMTADEFYEWVHRPENANQWFELVRGKVIEMPPPQKRHGFVSVNVGRLLGNYTFRRRKGYVTGNDSGVILEKDPDTVRGPDIALYEDAQKYLELHPKYGEVPPRLAVEVLSPNDRADRVIRKITDYLNNGVEMVWLIDPEARTVTVYRANKGPLFLEEGDELTGQDVLPGFRCRVADIFFLPGDLPETKEAKGKPPGKRRSRKAE
jgi:Uma2 family endonuclease